MSLVFTRSKTLYLTFTQRFQKLVLNNMSVVDSYIPIKIFTQQTNFVVVVC